jgi:hypothetical protein
LSKKCLEKVASNKKKKWVRNVFGTAFFEKAVKKQRGVFLVRLFLKKP